MTYIGPIRKVIELTTETEHVEDPVVLPERESEPIEETEEVEVPA